MADIVDYSIYVGAADWRHAHWRNAFYPEELPEEWMLSFYNSQFRCTYLPFLQWENNLASVAKSWLADTQPNFRFILEPPDLMNEHTVHFLEAMGNRALLDRVDLASSQILWFPPEPDLRLLGREIQLAIDQGRTLYLLNREAHLPALEKVRSLVEVMGY